MSKLSLRKPNNIIVATAKLNNVRTVVFIKDYTGEKPPRL